MVEEGWRCLGQTTSKRERKDEGRRQGRRDEGRDREDRQTDCDTQWEREEGGGKEIGKEG